MFILLLSHRGGETRTERRRHAGVHCNFAEHCPVIGFRMCSAEREDCGGGKSCRVFAEEETSIRGLYGSQVCDFNVLIIKISTSLVISRFP